MNDSRHYFRLKGVAAEIVVQDLAVRSYFTDWCYPNPRLPDGKELCDLLVVFDRVVIIWQIKNLKLGSNGCFNEKDVEKNIRQLSGARRQMFDLKRPITLSNPRRGSEPFDPSRIEEVYLISVLAGESQDVSSILHKIGEKTVHVFNGKFVEIVTNELDTVADFVGYLKAKEALFENLKGMTIVGGEEDILASFVWNGRNFDHFSGFTHVVVEGESWARLQTSPEYKAKKSADEISYFWDDMINRVHTANSPEYERVARELARLNRFKRRCLSKVFYEAQVKAHGDPKHDILRRALADEDCTYCFLFADDPEPRNRRKSMLENFCYVARGKYRQNAKVIGIATEKRIRPTCTYDFCLLDMPEWSEENAKQAEGIQLRTGILTNITNSQAHEDEYPQNTPSKL